LRGPGNSGSKAYQPKVANSRMTTSTEGKVQMVSSAQHELTASNPVPRSAISPVFVGASLAFACLYLGAVGVITAIIPNGLFARIVEPTVWSYIFWIAPAALFGVLAASYIFPLLPSVRCSG
jgi:hypothetical protein